MQIDKMFEYDFGIDYSDTANTINERARQYRENRQPKGDPGKKLSNEPKLEVSFWGTLIASDIMSEQRASKTSIEKVTHKPKQPITW